MNSLNQELESLWDYFTGAELWLTLGRAGLKIVLILILASVIIKVGKNMVDRIFRNRMKGPLKISERRESTINKLIQNVLSYVVYFTAIVMILDTMTIPIASLLAGAGVVGLAIGFGAQSLVQDVISGFFIIFEDQFGIGDYVLCSEVEGTVLEIGLRTTKIQAWTGELNVIPNGKIDQVTNYSTYNGLAVVDVNVPYESDFVKAEQVIENMASSLQEKYEEIVSIPEVIGVQSLEDSYYVIRVIAETLPVYQWAGARVIRQEIKDNLYSEGIEIPSPRLVMYSRNEEPNGFEIGDHARRTERGNE